MSFFTISPREKDNINKALPLKVLMDKGVEVEPLIDINVTDLNRDNSSNILYKHFHVNGDGGIKINIDVIIDANDKWGNDKVLDLLHKWYANLTPLFIRSSAIDVKNKGKYLITNNPSRKQTYKGKTVWSLEFMTYNPLTIAKYKNDNTNIRKALKAFNKAKKKAQQQAKKRTLNYKLSKCKVSNMKLKKKNDCCGYLNSKLVKGGYLSKKEYKKMQKKKEANVFTKQTANAIKKFQRKFKGTENNFTYGLVVTGKMNKDTLKALCKS